MTNKKSKQEQDNEKRNLDGFHKEIYSIMAKYQPLLGVDALSTELIKYFIATLHNAYRGSIELLDNFLLKVDLNEFVREGFIEISTVMESQGSETEEGK